MLTVFELRPVTKIVPVPPSKNSAYFPNPLNNSHFHVSALTVFGLGKILVRRSEVVAKSA